MKIFKRKEIILLLRLIVGVTFVYASFSKILHPDQFAMSIRSYQLLPVGITNLFALVLAWAQLVAGILLIAGLFTRRAAGAILLMLVMFIGALSIVLVKGMVIDCGCFSSDGGSPVSILLIARNTLMSGACVIIMKYDRGFWALGR